MRHKKMKVGISILIAVVMLLSFGGTYGSTTENSILVAEEKAYSDVTDNKQALSIADQCNIFNYVDEKEFLSNGFTKRVYSEEDLNTYIFERDDGTRSLYVFGEDVKFEDASGIIYEKDLSLQKTNNGYTTKKNNVGLLLPDRLSDGVKLFNGKKELILFAPDDKNAEAQKTGNAVKYSNVYGDNANFVFTPTLSGIKQDVVLESFTGSNSFDIIVSSVSLRPFFDETGALFFAETETDGFRFIVGSVFVYDSSGRFTGGNIQIDQLSDNKWILTLVVPVEFLVSKNTVYPVTIDPVIEIRSENNSSYIEDTTVYSGKPNLATGTWTYNHTGFLSDGYNIGRMLVRTPGLYNNSAFSSIQASQIDSAKFYIKEATGSAAQEVKLYAYTGTSWSENTATWNNTSPSGSYTLIDTKNPAYDNYVEFNVTNLVKGWKNGTYTASLGFMLKSSDESNVSNAKAYDASESAYLNVQPYITVSYRPLINLQYYLLNLNESETCSNLATTVPTGVTVQWTSSDTTIATVSSTGIITGVRASATPVTITATVLDPYGPAVSQTCTVYVKIPDGVYYFKNMYSNTYLNSKDGKIIDGTDVNLRVKYNNDASTVSKLRQMWKIFYLGSGKYSFRPMHKLNMGMIYSSGNACISDIGTNDTLSGVADIGEWTIDRDLQSGLIIKNKGLDVRILQYGTSSGSATTKIGVPNNSSKDYWSEEIINNVPSGIILYDSVSNDIITETYRFLNVGESKTISQLNIIPAVYSPISISQEVTWNTNYSPDPKVSVDNLTGLVTAIKAGSENVYIHSDSNSSISAYYIAGVNRLPEPDPQNRIHWCWAACSKMVGVHNGGSGALSTIPLPITYNSGLLVWTSYYCGQLYTGQFTVDGGQGQIVTGVKGTAESNSGGNSTEIRQALQIASYNTMSTSAISNIKDSYNLSVLKNELSSGKWVVAGLVEISGGTYHAVVIQNYDIVTSVFSIWDPFDNLYWQFSETDLLNDQITLRTLISDSFFRVNEIVYCN
jgi:hypothetical protein